MEFEIRTLPLTSTDNIHTLVGKIYIPKGEIKGLFHLVHGMTEYIDRYDHLFTFLAQNGYVAFGFDNLGHGKSVRDDSELGFIAHKNGWKYLVHDCIAYSKAVKEMFPQKPLILMGHSMGSFITRLAVEYAPDIYDKFIICGTSGPNPLAKFGLIYAQLVKFMQGEKHVSNIVYNLAFGSYNKRFDGNTNYEWLTKDHQIIDKYAADKYCTFKFTVSAMIDLMKLVSGCNRSDWYKTIRSNLPMFIISGQDDPVGNYGKGVTTVYNKLKNQDKNVTIKLYKNCRHEIHNDSCKDEMFSDILSFLN